MRILTTALTCALFAATASAKDLDPQEISQQQRNYGYAVLYSTFNGMEWADEFLILKKQSDVVKEMAKAVNDFSHKHKDKLEKLQEDYPGLKFKDTGRPIVLEKKIGIQVKEELKAMSPFGGQSGAVFERSYLILLQDLVVEIMYTAKTLAMMEPNASLHEILKNMQQDAQKLSEKISRVLNQTYFIDDAFADEKKNNSESKASKTSK